MNKTEDQYDRIAAIFLLATEAFVGAYARTVHILDWTELGPGSMPFWAGVFLNAMAVVLLIEGFGSSTTSHDIDFSEFIH
jgi:hypothetical protein